jgi:hypothetical protein
MCPRRINGGALNPLISLNEITLEQFKEWFSVEFIQQLDSLFMCGNLGDPIIAQDCLEIFQYLRTTNPTIRLSMHTNGSARNKAWWQALAETKVKVTFGIDGSLQITHSAYRIGTDLDKILENAQAFITAGGDARWDMLVFKHNEHQIDACRKRSKELGFTEFRTKHTSRFAEDSLTVLDDAGKPMHVLFPTETSKAMISKVKEAQEVLENLDNLRLSISLLKERISYRKAAKGGLSIVELDKQDNKAVDEFLNFYNEVFNE